ncbi:hypothetical protein F5146DRAFT_1006594 [Armillaria mellea]|nr:hypothetical protein F5146DRAFT_1006594 [Armillaria mellea]
MRFRETGMRVRGRLLVLLRLDPAPSRLCGLPWLFLLASGTNLRTRNGRQYSFGRWIALRKVEGTVTAIWDWDKVTVPFLGDALTPFLWGSLNLNIELLSSHEFRMSGDHSSAVSLVSVWQSTSSEWEVV